MYIIHQNERSIFKFVLQIQHYPHKFSGSKGPPIAAFFAICG